MNDTLKTIANRYSCRNFTDKAISSENLKLIGDAGIQAPSAMNRQGWQIAVVNNKALISEIEAEGLRIMSELPDKSAYLRIMSRGGKLFYNANAVVFIANKTDATLENLKYAKVDLGIVAENIALAAYSLGIDNCHCGLAAFCFMGNKAEEFKERLKFSKDYECGYAVLLGYGKEQGKPHTPDKTKVIFVD